MVYSTKDKGRVPNSAVDYLLGSTFQKKNGQVCKLSKWQKADEVRIQEVEKNDEISSDQGISDGDESVESSQFFSVDDKKLPNQNEFGLFQIGYVTVWPAMS